MKSGIELLKEFEQLKTDRERWKYIIDNKGNPNYVILLDNDHTQIDFKGTGRAMGFKYFVGWHTGVCVLLDAVGINAEPI